MILGFAPDAVGAGEPKAVFPSKAVEVAAAAACSINCLLVDMKLMPLSLLLKVYGDVLLKA